MTFVIHYINKEYYSTLDQNKQSCFYTNQIKIRNETTEN